MDDESRLPALSAGRPPLKAESRPLASVPDDILLRRLAEILGQSRRVETHLIAHIAVLRRASHRSKRKIEELIAEVAPRKDAPSLMRRLPEKPRPAILAPTPSVAAPSAPVAEPTPSGMGNPVAPSPPHLLALPPDASSFSGSPSPISLLSPPVVQPLAPGRYKVQFTASAGLHEKLERLRALMRSQVPDGDLGALIEAAVTEKLERLEARRFAATTRPRRDLSMTDTSPSSRRIPAAVRRSVHERDGGRCRYVDASGRRCEERHHLEYHHIHPFGLGGDHRPENIRLMCAQHNAYLAERDYGRGTMARFRRSGRPGTLRASGAPSSSRVAAVASSGTAGGPPRVAPRGP